MAFTPVFNTIKVVVSGLLQEQEVVNVFHLQAPTTPTPTLIEDATGQVDDAYQARLLASLSDDFTVTEVTGTDISVVGGEQFIIAYPAGVAGGVVGAAAPNNVAAGITWQTARVGRSFRGRTYLPGVAETVITNSTIDPGSLAGWQAEINTFVDEMNANGFSFVVVSYMSEGEPRVTPLRTPIVQGRLNATVRTQRRRLPGIGS